MQAPYIPGNKTQSSPIQAAIKITLKLSCGFQVNFGNSISPSFIDGGVVNSLFGHGLLAL